MLIQILACFLIAAGVLLCLWCLVGWLLLPFGGDDLQLVLKARDDADRLERQLRACAWLQSSGLLRGELLVLDCGLREEGHRLVEKLAAKYDFIFKF